MRRIITGLAVTAALAIPCLDRTSRVFAAQPDSMLADVALYQVPLMCPAASGLGCGSRAKPILLDLEKRPGVEAAWLNEAGDILAVVWTCTIGAAEQQAVIAAVTDAHHVSISELDAERRPTALTSFRSGAGWHKGADVDRLSEREAGVIADRLLHRVVAKIPAVQRKAGAVGPELTKTIRRMLISGCTSSDECRDALLAAARAHLDASELTALRDAIARGFTPVDGEK